MQPQSSWQPWPNAQMPQAPSYQQPAASDPQLSAILLQQLMHRMSMLEHMLSLQSQTNEALLRLTQQQQQQQGLGMGIGVGMPKQQPHHPPWADPRAADPRVDPRVADPRQRPLNPDAAEGMIDDGAEVHVILVDDGPGTASDHFGSCRRAAGI